MLGTNGSAVPGELNVHTTSGRGLNVEELADLAMRKLVHVADTAPPILREQANQFKAQIRLLLIAYMHQAIKSDRTTLYNQLRGAGFPEVADIILKI
jgi:hypothetical protein